MDLNEYLRENFLKSKNPHLIDIYTGYADSKSAIHLFTNRIIDEFVKCGLIIELIHKKMPEEKNEISNMGSKLFDNIDTMRIDIIAFYLFVRMHMDIFCRIIKECYGKRGKQFPNSMSDLLKLIKEGKLKDEFLEELLKRTDWFSEFKDERDKILHELGSPHIIGDSGGISFQIGKYGDSIGSDKSKLINDFVGDTNQNINNIASFLIFKLPQANKLNNQNK